MIDPHTPTQICIQFKSTTKEHSKNRTTHMISQTSQTVRPSITHTHTQPDTPTDINPTRLTHIHTLRDTPRQAYLPTQAISLSQRNNLQTLSAIH